MTGNVLFDCQEMFRHACSFCECADLALEKFQHDTVGIDFYTSPAIINSAFACEVFMKAILQFEQTEIPKTHKLKELYDALPQEIKEHIKRTVSAGHRNMWFNPFGKEYLDEVSNAFVEWRYSYEHDWSKSCSMHINIGFLTRFRDSLRDICYHLFCDKSWDKYKR